MHASYTQAAVQQCLDLIDSSITAVWEDIESTPEDTDKDRWKKKLHGIADEFMCSSRFALMRFLLSEVEENMLLDVQNPEEGFSFVDSYGIEHVFHNITMEHAQTMSDKELSEYKDVLLERAADQADANREKDTILIQKALLYGSKKKVLISREEAFRLGHMLKFPLSTMKWFLLRVFDFDSGFDFSSSNDLIEAYGFLIDASATTVEKLKESYSSQCASIPKAQICEKPNNYTRDIGGSLEELVRKWNSDDRDQFFLSWMKEQAPMLDTQSTTALRIYRNLAVYLCTIEEIDAIPPEKLMQRYLTEIVTEEELTADTIDALYENDEISPEKCKQVSDKLLLINKNYTSSWQENKAKAYHVLSTMDNGKLTLNDVQMNILNTERKESTAGSMIGVVPKTISTTRICELLRGNIQHIDKVDLLYLLWIYEIMCWDQFDSDNTIKNRLVSFISMAKIILRMSLLPDFYPAHLMEKTMMLSIVCGGLNYDDHTPGEIYEIICDSIIMHRAKHKNKKRNKNREEVPQNGTDETSIGDEHSGSD